ncbi:MAG: ABC transporter permease [Muribaculaceae bacterium]|nr:ABC transporter permease [Muribaculaceae bacterium]
MVALRIALRYLFSRKSHNAVNIISWISVAGVAVATAAIVCVLSVFNGFSDVAMSRLSAVDPDIKIVPAAGKSFADGDSLAAALAALPQFQAAVPTVEERALAIYAGRQLPVTVKGVPDNYGTVIDLAPTVIDGELMDSDGDYPCAALSVGVAVSLGAHPGYYDPLYLYVPRRNGRVNVANPAASFMADTLLVSAVYEVEQTEHDADRAVVPLSVMRSLLEYTTEASAIELKIAPGVSTDQALAAASEAVGSRGVALSRLMQQSESFRMISVEKWLTFVMLIFILVIASFNVISTMSMLIIEKKDNIATLRALGASPSTVSGVFLMEGWLISLLGGVSGIVIGVILCLAQQYGGFIKLGGDPSQLNITEYPVKILPGDLLVVLMLVAVVGFVIGLIASRISSARSVDNATNLQ